MRLVGRLADQVLADKYQLLRVFITSGEEARINRIMDRDNLSAAEAKKKIAKVDKEEPGLLQPVLLCQMGQLWKAMTYVSIRIGSV